MTQTAFLDALIDQGISVTIYLRNGVGINGRLQAHDVFSLQVQLHDGSQSLVYKSEISNLKACQAVSVHPMASSKAGGGAGGRFNSSRRGPNASRS